MVLHLSVASDGIVSLWDTAKQASRQEGEVYVPLELTDRQREQIQAAERAATKANQPPEENPRQKGDDDGQEYGDPRDALPKTLVQGLTPAEHSGTINVEGFRTERFENGELAGRPAQIETRPGPVERWQPARTFRETPMTTKIQAPKKCGECNGTGKLTRLGGDWGKTGDTEVPCWKCGGKG